MGKGPSSIDSSSECQETLVPVEVCCWHAGCAGNSSQEKYDCVRESSLAAGNGNKSTRALGGRRSVQVEASGAKRKGRNGLNGSISVLGSKARGRNGVCAHGIACQSKGKRYARRDNPEARRANFVPLEISDLGEQHLQQRNANGVVASLEEYQYIPNLEDDLALLCLARVPRIEYDNLRLVNRKFRALIESGELFKIRRRSGIVEQWVYMVATGQFDWQSFDPKSGRWRRLPPFEADYCYHSCDKESFSVGSQLLVVGWDAAEGLIIWRYELSTNQWAKGSVMLTPRCLYAWGSCGKFAYVAGGITQSGVLLQSAEKYDPEREVWERLPDMIEGRKLCAGFFMDGKFYVIGGEGKSGDLTSAEVYDPASKTWTLIPNMLSREGTRSFPGAPPLIAVVRNELYVLEAESNQVKVYSKRTNSWKVLGEAPVRADLVNGWGIAFKSIGDHLLAIGGARTPGHDDGMYMCKPDPEDGPLHWEFLARICPFGPFVQNCAIVSA